MTGTDGILLLDVAGFSVAAVAGWMVGRHAGKAVPEFVLVGWLTLVVLAGAYCVTGAEMVGPVAKGIGSFMIVSAGFVAGVEGGFDAASAEPQENG